MASWRAKDDHQRFDYAIAVIVGDPDHSHCFAMVDSLSAAKHVYVEKPSAHTIEECQ